MYNYTLDYAIKSLPIGTYFKVKDIDKTYWNSFSDTDKRMLGKEFFKDVTNSIYSNAVFINKNASKNAIYKKI